MFLDSVNVGVMSGVIPLVYPGKFPDFIQHFNKK